jgi:O-antigen/teichoic acid export membrane protein
MSTALYLAAPLIIRIAFGARYESSVGTLRLLSPLPLLIAVSNVVGIQVLFPFHREKVVLASVAAGGVLNLLLAFLLAPVLKANGMAFSVMCSEMLVTVIQLWYVARHRLLQMGPIGAEAANA